MTYQFSSSQVHIVKWFPGQMPGRLKCFRCKRDMPEESFVPLQHTGAFRTMKGGGYIQYLHPFCHECRKQAHGRHTRHPLYAPKLDRFWSRRASTIRAASKKRGILFLVNKDDLLGQYLIQNGKCAISGMQMECGLEKGAGRIRVGASVDRIDSNGNYTVDNIQIVCGAVNTMKQDMHQSDFIKWCRLIAHAQDKREEDLLTCLSLDAK